MTSLAIRNIGSLATPLGTSARRGRDQGSILRVPDAAIRAENGRLVFVGTEADYRREYAGRPAAEELDAGRRAVIPGLVDAHTHPVWLGDRGVEIGRRLAGESYSAIAAEGGGIQATVRATRAGSDEELREATAARLGRMLAHGTTTAEAKSGYGLTVEEELRQLRLLRDLSGSPGLPRLIPTLLAAHEFPPEFRDDRAEWVRIVADSIVPRAAEERLAAFCDVFCEQGVFSVDQSRRILGAARELGLGLRIHADELADSGGAQLAGELHARSADHLIFASDAGMEALARAGCVATLLPAAAFYLRLGRFAPARALLEAGVPLALASDVNPGGGLSPSLPFAMALGCFGMGLSLEQALVAATVNAAYSLDVHEQVGSLELGKRADLLVLRSERLLDLLRVGVAAIRTVVKDGRIVAQDGRRF
jgi:imidazolonepropionase